MNNPLKRVFSSQSAARLVAATLGASAVLLTGCVPLIPTDGFVDLTSSFALAPQRTCEELRRIAGVSILQDVANPGELGLDYEEAIVPTSDGETLRLWYIPSPEDRGTIVFSMGAVADIGCYLFIPMQLQERGWSVVIYDYQGFGGSSGQASLNTLVGDLDAVMDWTMARIAHPQVTLLGASVGTIPTVTQAVLRADEVNALVLDGAISFRAEIDRLWFLYGGQTDRYLAQFDQTLWLAEQIKSVTQPIQAFAYGRDEYATSHSIEQILAKSPAPSSVHYFEDLGHSRGPYRNPDEYFGIVEPFLTSVWSE